ncbi:iron ABC transporter permease, partial [Rhizobium ruizarguesonis]
GSGSPRPTDRRRLGWFVVPAVFLPLILAVLTLGVPLVTLGRWLYLGVTDIWRIDVGNAFLQAIGAAAIVASTPPTMASTI